MQIYPMYNNNPCFGIYQISHSMAPSQKIKETSFTFKLAETTIIFFMRNTKVFFVTL